MNAPTPTIPLPRYPAEPNYREYRTRSPKYVRCPRGCDPAIGCPQCCFWGTVLKGSSDATCVHEHVRLFDVTQTLHTRQCIKCGIITTVDSSG